MRKIITSFLVYQLIVPQVVFSAESGVIDLNRNAETQEEINSGATPSDIPYLGYSEYFTPEHIKLLDKQNLTAKSGKQIYVGYGVYDPGDLQCKFIDLPNEPRVPIESAFLKSKTFMNKSYIQYRQGELSYSACDSIANEYGGHMPNPMNAAENSFLSMFGVDAWLDGSRSDCNAETEYLTSSGNQLNMTNWDAGESIESCDTSKLNIYIKSNSTWNRANMNEQKQCIVEIDSPYPERPIKMCAPWWRVERTYTKPENLNVGGIDLTTINQADIPEKYNICTRFNQDAINAINNDETYEFQCTTYYDSTLKPECMADAHQPQCKVSECKGYVEDACKHIKEIEPLKDYTKITKVVHGTVVEQKGKVGIRTQIYQCPIIVPDKTDCLSKNTVVVYPKECSTSDCDGLKQCIHDATDSTELIACNQTFTCEKIYPKADVLAKPEDIDGDLLKFLRGTCSSGEELQFEVNVQSKKEKVCKEYSHLDAKMTIQKQCELEKTYEDYSVNMTITSEDIYQNDEQCVRTNNIQEGRPTRDIIFDVDYYNFAENYISKMEINNNNIIEISKQGTSDYIQELSKVRFGTRTGDGTVVDENQPDYCPFADANEVDVSDWGDEIEGFFYAGYSQSYFDEDFVNETGSENNESNCKQSATDLALEFVDFESATKTCQLKKEASEYDLKFNSIKPIGQGDDGYLLEFVSRDSEMTTSECQDWAECLNAVGVLGNGGYCVASQVNEDDIVTSGSDVSDIEGGVTDCRPTVGQSQSVSSVNGLADLFVIEDTIEGFWGYSANYNSHEYLPNTVKVNGKEVFPILGPSRIIDRLSYIAKIQIDSLTSKKARILAGAYTDSGGITDAAIFASVIPFLNIGLFVVEIVNLIFSKKRHYNEASIYWMLYKDIPKARYIRSKYDFRKIVDMETFIRAKYRVMGEDPGDNGWYWKTFTGTLLEGDFNTYLENLLKQKEQTFTCLGFSQEQTPISQEERSENKPGYPRCKWYEVGCNKRSSGEVAELNETLNKNMSGFFLGADNSVSILTPFIGDYEIIAFNKSNEPLGTIQIRESDFINESGSTMAYAQLNFGQVMNLANGVPEGDLTGACRDIRMVEFGGGVSGIYFENADAGGVYNANCSKSNDDYVRDHSVSKLKLRPLNQKDFVEIKLKLPMPYANRIKLVTLSQKEIRNYRCFSEDFGTCEDDDFITEINE